MKTRFLHYHPWMANFALAIGLALFATGCNQKDWIEPSLRAALEKLTNEKKTKTFYGAASPIGQGVARLWVTVDQAGNPVTIGVTLSEKAVMNLGDGYIELNLSIPKQVEILPFDHVILEYNPHGHDPEGIYTTPHFDLHFYMISEEVRMQIPGKMPPYMDPAPAAKYIPEAYIQGPGIVPAMGVHWLDVLSSEFQPGGSFTRTFIYGTYNGKVTFLEPMFTVAYLKSHPKETIMLRQPQAVQKSGFYPASYSFSYSRTPKEFTISLDNLTYREAQ